MALNPNLANKKKRGLTAFNAGEFDDAEKLLSQVCKKAKKDPESWYVLGMIYGQTNQLR